MATSRRKKRALSVGETKKALFESEESLEDDYDESDYEESESDSASENSSESDSTDNSDTIVRQVGLGVRGQNKVWKWKKRQHVPKIHNFLGISEVSDELKMKIYDINGTVYGSDLYLTCRNERPMVPNFIHPAAVFEALFTNDMISEIATETNKYYEQTVNTPRRKTKYREDKWSNTTVEELKLYFGLILIMSRVRKDYIFTYWSKRLSTETPYFRDHMTRDRFQILTRFLHFNDNEQDGKEDRLFKLRPIIDQLNRNFDTAYSLQDRIAIDESLVKFKGRLSYVQYNPKKRARFGIKVYKLAESESGYVKRFKIYTGDDKKDGTPASSQVVLDFLRDLDLQNNGYTLYLDNWYSSPDLYKTLHGDGFNVVGTVRCNRKNMPKDFPKQKKGEISTRYCNEIVAVKWTDKKDVYMLSTKHVGKMENTEKIDRSTGEPKIKPDAVIDYNTGMGGVDRNDQVLSIFPVMRKTVKGYRKLFFYLLDISLYNAYILFKKLGGKVRHYGDFRLEVGENLAERYKNSRPSLLKKPSPTRRFDKSRYQHTPERIPNTVKQKKPRKRCVVCYKKRLRKNTFWQCAVCKVGLHLESCFQKYHTKL